jgi:hypothetical protein
VVAQAVPSGVEAEADSQSALRDVQQAAKHMHLQADLDAADGFQDTYLKPLRIFDAVTRKIANVWTLLSIGTELI